MHDPNQEIYDRVCFLLDEVESRLEEGFPEEGLQLALQAELLVERHQGAVTADLRVDCQYCLASCHFELHDLEAALRRYEAVRALDPTDHEIDYWQARALFHSWQFQAAGELLQGFRPCNATRAGSFWYRALLSDFAGDQEGSDVLFSRAQREQPEEFTRPLRLKEGEMQAILGEVLQSLPPDVRQSMAGVDVDLAALPDPQVHASPDIDPLVTCVYRSRLPSTASLFGPPPPRSGSGAVIEVFQRNLELLAGDRDELREEVRLSLLQQIGQHLGRDSNQGPPSSLN